MKEITVFINGTPKTVEKNKEYTFEEVVVLAFGSYDDAAKDYTMTSTNKNGKDPRDYSVGDKIKMKEDMRINVDLTINVYS